MTRDQMRNILTVNVGYNCVRVVVVVIVW